jgi:precorrin-6B methylase 1
MALLTPTLMAESASMSQNAKEVAASATGDTCPNDGNVLLLVKNASAGSETVTVTPAKTSAQVAGFGTMAKNAVAVAVAAGDSALIGPFTPGMFNDANGNLDITYSGVTSLSIAAIRIPRI